MKKIQCLIMLMIFVLILTGCGSRFFSTTKAERDFEKLIRALEDEDSEKIKKMFSSEAINESENLDENIEEMIEYFEGNYQSHTLKGMHADQTTDETTILTVAYYSYDVVTDVGTYRFAIKYIVTDLEYSEREGFLSLYITSAELSDEYAYHGDNVYTPGVTVEKEQA